MNDYARCAIAQRLTTVLFPPCSIEKQITYCSPNLRCSFGNFDREELDAR